MLILPSIALKRCNFPKNLGFKGKIMAKFLIRSHFFSNISKNMTIKQQISHGAMPKVCPLHNSIFHSIPFHSTCVTLCQSFSISSPKLVNKNIKLSIEIKEDFLYIWLLQHITLYQRGSISHLTTKFHF